MLCFFFFKQKTAYEMRISDWSSDVCSSDLPPIVPSTASAGPAASAGATSAGGKLQGKADNVYPLQRDREKDKPPMSNRLPVMLLDRLLKRLIREGELVTTWPEDRKSTRLTSSH